MKALVLAGGFPQIALIKELKSRGIETILADYNEEPVAKKYADRYYRASTLDIDAISKIATDEEVDFLITACTDQALLTVAKVSESLGLPCYIDYETARNVTNKAYMKKVFGENSVSTAKHVTLSTLEMDKIEGMKFPLIVKPADCNSSKGVKKVQDNAELEKAFADAVKFSRTDTAVVEEFISGVELSVDVYVENGKANVLSVCKLDKIANNDKFVIFRGWYNPIEADAVKDKIEKTAQQIADAFNLKDTPMLIQMMSDGEDVYVLEFSARTGGGVKYLLIKNVSGFDVIKAVVDLTLGVKPHIDEIKSQGKFIVNDFIYCKPGKFDHLEGFEELKNDGTMHDYYVFKWKGAEFDSIDSSGDRVAGYTVCADTFEQLCERHKKINSIVKVISESGEDMMRHDLITEIGEEYKRI